MAGLTFRSAASKTSSGFFLGAFLDQVHGVVNDAQGGAFLAAFHHVLHHGLELNAVIAHVGRDWPPFGTSTSHTSFSSDYFGRFAPYFERPCLRLATPVVSSEPRTM